jgi:hypothetical protein
MRIHDKRVKANWKEPRLDNLQARGPSFSQAAVQKQLVLVGVLQGFQRGEREQIKPASDGRRQRLAQVLNYGMRAALKPVDRKPKRDSLH